MVTSVKELKEELNGLTMTQHTTGMGKGVRKCIICGKGINPHRESPYCHEHEKEIKSLVRKKVPGAFMYACFRGQTIGFYPIDNGKLTTRLETGTKFIPKCKMINLDNYCPGYTRAQVKKMKKAILRLARVY